MKKFLTLTISLFLVASAYSQELIKVRIDDFSGGQNSYDLADSIDVNQGELVQNASQEKRGRLEKRKGQALFADDLGNTAFRGVGDFYPDSTTSYVLAASGTDIVRSTSAGASWTVVNTGKALTAGYNTEFLQADNLLFIFNGEDNTSWYDGSTFVLPTSVGTVYPASPPKATTGAWVANYLFLAGNPTYPDWVYFSNNLEPREFTANNVIKINTGDGQEIVRIEPFRENEIIVYKQRSVYMLDITGSTPLADWAYKPISRTIGCAAERSVVNIGNDHWFLSSEPIAVRSLIRSSFDKILLDRASDPIQDIFDGTGETTINVSSIDVACAILHDNKYILGIPTGVSTVNDYVVVYDFLTKSWTTIDGWYPAEWIVYENDLYYIDANDGRMIECFTGTTGDMYEGPVVTGSSEPSVAITFDWRSKNISFDNPENYKMLDALDLELGASGDYDADVYIEMDDGGWQRVGDMNLAGGAVTLPVSLPFTLSASGVARETFQLQQYGEFKNIKIRVVQDGLSELCDLHRATIFAYMKPWRRE